MAEEPDVVAHTPSTYCREIETYLCRKNEGHLIRIVGPAFEQVCAWAERGVPLKIAFRGIDRCCERHQAKGPRRRPVRIEFCEADVLEAFDDWRRAIGVAAGAQDTGGAERTERRAPLHAHIERAAARLRAVNLQGQPSSALENLVRSALTELEAMERTARGARGAGRAALLERLGVLDGELGQAATAAIRQEIGQRLRRDAEAELAPFAGRMAPQVHNAAVEAAFERLVREALGLPVVRYE